MEELRLIKNQAMSASSHKRSSFRADRRSSQYPQPWWLSREPVDPERASFPHPVPTDKEPWRYQEDPTLQPPSPRASTYMAGCTPQRPPNQYQPATQSPPLRATSYAAAYMPQQPPNQYQSAQPPFHTPQASWMQGQDRPTPVALHHVPVPTTEQISREP